MENEPFKEHSWYFRNALVRANYEDVTRGISPDAEYLDRFFENLLCGTRHELKNRYLHLDWPRAEAERGATQETSETTQETSETTQETSETTQEKLLALLGAYPTMSAKLLATELGITFDGVRYHLARLKKAGRIHHESPNKGGRWVVDS